MYEPARKGDMRVEKTDMSTHVRVMWLEVMREGEEVLGDRDEVMMRDGRWRPFAGAVICCVQKRMAAEIMASRRMSCRCRGDESASCSIYRPRCP